MHRKKRQEAGSPLSLRRAVRVGLVLLLLVAAMAGHLEIASTADLAQSTMQTVKQQCLSFNRLSASDRTKSLFRLSDMMRELSEELADRPELASDEYLEHYVDSLRLSGVALLDGALTLEASGHTRQFRDSDWTSSLNGKHFADILDYPAKVYLERISADGEYYDVCAVARRDAPGILVGFYRQPAGLISDTQSDLESLMTGIHLERSGHYAVVEDGQVRAASDEQMKDAAVKQSELLQALSRLPKDDRLHLFRAGRTYGWGCRSGFEGYSLYIYYPVKIVFSAWLLSAAIFAAGYGVLLAMIFFIRNKALYEKQAELEKSNCDLAQTVRMLKALETIYFSLFYVDLEADRYDSMYLAPWLQPSVPQSGVYTELKQMFLTHMTQPEYREEIDRRMSPAFIRQMLNRENTSDVRKSFYTDYQAIRGSEVRWCRVTATVVDYDAAGTPAHVLALLQDIDEEKKREAEYQAQILKEAHEAKVANQAKTDFLRRISHDIRTPLNGIQGYIDMASRHPEDSALQQHCRENATSALQILLDLVNSLLEMSKLESAEITLEEKPFDLTALLDSVNALLIPQAEARSVRFETLRQRPVPETHLLGSPQQVTRVIMNVTANAVKYAKPGGYVRVDTKLIARTEDTATYQFICEDNGVGMGEEFQRHMFEPFTQEAVNARSTYEGSGLGLSIVKKLVEAMGGTITCESQKDVGTVFRTQLTFRIDRSFSGQAAPEKAKHAACPGLRVLLVEDNELNMEIAEYLLLERNVKLTKAWNGKQALEAFKASAPGEFDLILMDVMMPEMNGLEATRAIRACPRPDAAHVQIFAMSANSFQDDIDACLKAGMNGHLAKPIEAERLWAVLEKAACSG